MPDIVGIRFKRAGKVYYFDPAGVDLTAYDHVVVQTARGIEMGQVAIAPKQVLESELTAELKPIVRKATEEDIKRAQDFAAKEGSAMAECTKMIAKLNLPMKLVEAEYNIDGSRLTFYFTAEERVDFRELVRELTAFFKTRIELRQIGPRDQAKQIGGMGRCGRTLCCVSYLTEFAPVSIKMAKEQDLPLDPMKISGVCGRLQCCLAYENTQYHEAKAKMPRRGQRVSTPSGIGFVLGINPLKETVLVELESKAEVECTLNEIGTLQSEPVIQGAKEAAEEPAVIETPVVETAAAAGNESSEPEANPPKPQDQQVNPAPPQ
ncbi:MAG: stage 0 sporulation family protein [Dehalococcoidales bacterium]|nr:stage 0 sporulation family protein [Dehalococcoidales bacterium]